MTRKHTTGFTLTEVMFAVITLGIGLIMIAAVFPVAIQQRKLTSEETIASGSAATGMQVMAQIGSQSGALPPTANVVQALPAATWQLVRGNLVSSTDPRVAWVPLYRRAAGDPNAQVFVIGVQVRNASVYTSADVLGTPANLEPRAVNVTIADGTAAGAVDTITLNSGAVDAAANGAYVIISSDTGSGGWMNGRIYRLGVATGTTNQYELIPGWDFSVDAGPDGTPSTGDDVTDITNADAFIIGRGIDPATGTYGGPVMDVAAYTGFVPAAN